MAAATDKNPKTSGKILVAEDNPALVAVIRFNLEQGGYEVVGVENGKQAWELLANGRFDLVITDQQMPEMTGIELVERLRGGDQENLPIIMLTAKGLELDLGELRDRLGIEAVLSKPFSPFDLLEVVDQCLSERLANENLRQSV